MQTRSVLTITMAAALMAAAPQALSYFPSDFSIPASSGQSVVSSSSSSSSSSMAPGVTVRSASSSSSSSSRRQVRAASASSAASSLSETTQCVLDAVKKREQVIMDALQNYHAIMERMLQIRRNLILQGWSEEDADTRDTKLRTLWRTFGSAWRNKGIVMRDQRRDAWETYRTERTACGLYNGDDPESTGLTLDSQL